MTHGILLWTLFGIGIIVLLLIDLFVIHREDKRIPLPEALAWVGFWISLALIFNLGVFYWMGTTPALEFLTGYIIEYSLSMDNVFVWLAIFTYFSIPGRYQHKILFWGILGALIFRLLFIVAGVALIERFHEIIYLFGAFLVYSGAQLYFHRGEEFDPQENPVLQLLNNYLPVTQSMESGHFFQREGGKWIATPLFVTVVMVETTDVMFAFDSVPAILAITRDPFIVYSSNVFAILGLRALFFALEGLMRKLEYLEVGLSFILVYVGFKMLLVDVIHIPTSVSLGVVLGALTVSALVSWLFGSTDTEPEEVTGATESSELD